jgi:hypothetical protein
MSEIDKRALQILLFSVSQYSEEKKYDIPIFMLGNVFYDLVLEDKNIFKYQEYAFKMLWQSFFDCIFSDNYKTVLKNQIFVFSSIIISKNV